MNIEKELLKDYSKAQMLRITSFISNDEAYFEKLMYLVFKSQDAKVRQRAAWCMSNVFDIYPYLIYPYIATLINMLDEADLHDALKRNTLRVLQSINIPEHLQGKALELCYNFFKSSDEAIAIKVFAMSTIDAIIQKYPELIPEFIYDIELQYPYSSAGYQSRAKKILNKLKRSKK